MVAPTAKQDLLTRMLRAEVGGFSKELASYLLGLDFTGEEHDRMDELAGKSNEGTLTAEERSEFEWLVLLGDLLALMQIKARISLQEHQHAA